MRIAPCVAGASAGGWCIQCAGGSAERQRIQNVSTVWIAQGISCALNSDPRAASAQSHPHIRRSITYTHLLFGHLLVSGHGHLLMRASHSCTTTMAKMEESPTAVSLSPATLLISVLCGHQWLPRIASIQESCKLSSECHQYAGRKSKHSSELKRVQVLCATKSVQARKLSAPKIGSPASW